VKQSDDENLDDINRRDSDRRGGLKPAWAIIRLDNNVEVPCWIINESRSGIGLETRKQMKPFPLDRGGTYWMQIKPSNAKISSWVAGTIKHIREKGAGSGIYRVGVKITTVPPTSLGNIPNI